MNQNIPGKQTKKAVWELISSASGWLSGEHISELLGISRAAVSKHIASLRTEGHAIQASPRKGYMLLACADDLNLPRARKALSKTAFAKGEWIYYPTSASTNLEAILQAGDGAREGCVLISECQTAGRGRKKVDWFSAPRSLQFSIILRPALPFPDAEIIARSVCGIIKEAVECNSNLQAEVKLPNDVYVNGKKIAGVLVETGYRAGSLDWLVIGTGLNVNTLATDFPPNLQAKCTSILIEEGKPANRGEILQAILQRLDFWYKNISGGAQKC